MYEYVRKSVHNFSYDMKQTIAWGYIEIHVYLPVAPLKKEMFDILTQAAFWNTVQSESTQSPSPFSHVIMLQKKIHSVSIQTFKYLIEAYLAVTSALSLLLNAIHNPQFVRFFMV